MDDMLLCLHTDTACQSRHVLDLWDSLIYYHGQSQYFPDLGDALIYRHDKKSKPFDVVIVQYIALI